MTKKRICVIGAGPSGMSVLYHYNKLKEEGAKEMPDIVCYDKQSDWGGLWVYSWQTGTDMYGETVHGSMYQGMWSNNPKESIEYPDYTFQDHFNKPMPSFMPREVMLDYLNGRWSQSNLRQWIRFNHVVRHVTYNDDTDDFTVIVKNLPEDKQLPAQRFDYVIVASGHFSSPQLAQMKGLDKFQGRIIHSHDFRNASEFRNSTVLVVGSGRSAEDISIQIVKYGAKRAITSYRSKPMEYDWPPEIEERPLVKKIEGRTVYFIDSTSVNVDSIILCTGYLLHFPFLEDRLRLKTKNVLYPAGLHKGVLWTDGGNNRLMYIGLQEQIYTFTMFDVQAKWALGYINGTIKLPDTEFIEEEMAEWTKRSDTIPHAIKDIIAFQTDYLKKLADEVDYGYDLDFSEMINYRFEYSKNHPLSYRSTCYTSKFSGITSIPHHTPFMEAFDHSMDGFFNQRDQGKY